MNGMPMLPTIAHDVLGWTVIACGAIATAFTILISIYWVIRPGERDPAHPKNLVLRDDR
jgi:hypothetical protein